MVLRRFLPRDEQFFDYFRTSAANMTEAARALVDLLAHFEGVEAKVHRIRDLEHKGDEITHQIYQALNSTFVTPLDREDIQNLATKLDDVVDYIEEATRRLWLYRIDRPTPLIQHMACILSEQAEHLALAIPQLETGKQSNVIRQHIVEVNRLENEADDVFSQALGSVYDGASDIQGLIKAIRWSELYQLLEDATDRAEDVANTLEAIVLKYA